MKDKISKGASIAFLSFTDCNLSLTVFMNH